ncbi:ATP-dependent DNA ligase [Schleiferia thermophila]|uniref:ATP-dependent DNA ligase n=1 Tax=Schleiferia thermophila TaxID=884107 RepID=UPI003EEBA81D
MKQFTRLIKLLDTTNKTNEKISALSWYFSNANDNDKLWVVALFSGKKPKRAATSTELRKWASEMAGLPLWIVEESWHIAGDLAETLSKILADRQGEAFKNLEEAMDFIKSITPLSPEEKKCRITEKWLLMTADERFVFNKMILGGFRLGVSEGLLTKALAKSLNLTQDDVAVRLSGNWDPSTTSWQSLFCEQPSKASIKPYPFCLAYPLEEAPHNLGHIENWIIEYKWDGIRGQLIMNNQKVALWSRGEELITDAFPEFLTQLENKCIPDAVLDGEIIPIDNQGNPAPFHSLQPRLGRKKPSKKILSQYPVKFRAYDLIEYNGEDLRLKPLIERKNKLNNLVAQLNVNIIDVSALLRCNSWEEADELRARANEMGSEGLMVKKKESIYHTGRKKGDWYKWKIDPQTIDAVLVYAQRGNGRRANLYTDYTFALWKGEELVPFTKAYSGLTDDEIRLVDRFIRQNTLERFGPVRRVKPELVFEIAFEGIQPSKRHKAGIALRFPRIKRWRTDKKIEQADHLDTLLLKLESSMN